MRRLATFGSLAALSLLAACDSSDSTTSITSPSGASLSGASMASLAFAQTSSADSAQDVMDGIDLTAPDASSPSEVTSMPTPATGRIAGRAAGGEFLPSLSDTSAGYIVFAETKILAGFTQSDTVKVGWRNGTANTAEFYWLKGSKTWSTGSVETYSLTPAEGILLSSGRAWLESRRTFAGGLVHQVKLLADAGPDGSYETEGDNHIWSIAWAKIRANDTLSAAHIASVDSARPLNNDTGATIFAASLREGRNAKHPLQLSRSWKLVAMAKGNDTTILSVQATRTGVHGRIDSVTTTNADGSAWTVPGDTAVLRHFVRYAGQTASDTLLSREATLKIKLVAGLGKSGNLLLGASERRDHRMGAVANTQFSWSALTEVPEGSQPVDGTVLLVANLRDGRKATLEGVLEDGVLVATWTAPDGTVTPIRHTRP